MRVTSETKAATRLAILEAARRLFASNGFDATTTRDIARAAGIASGTVFNYFPTKEAVLACLAGRAAAEALESFAGAKPETGAPPTPAETLEEDLFGLVAASLRALRPLRKHLPVLLETTLSPLASPPREDGESLRTRHLEGVAAVAARHGHNDLPAVALQLYWTLYTGVLVFWANDPSPRQEDTLALTDESINMYVAWLQQQPGDEPGTAP